MLFKVLRSLGPEDGIARGEGFSALVRNLRVALVRHLSDSGRPTVAAVARRRRPRSRTLQPRLDENKTSFQQQLAGGRRTTASQLLANTDLDPMAIAMLRGFANPIHSPGPSPMGRDNPVAVARAPPQPTSLTPLRPFCTNPTSSPGIESSNSLSRGYLVRTTIRTLAKEAATRTVLEDAGMVHGDRLLFVAADLLRDQGWADAIPDVDFVLHVNSPVQPGRVENDDDVIGPALKGTRQAHRSYFGFLRCQLGMTDRGVSILDITITFRLRARVRQGTSIKVTSRIVW